MTVQGVVGKHPGAAAALLAACAAASPVQAANYDVCASGCAYSTIQDAVDAIPEGSDPDVVRVARGTYYESGINISRGVTVTIQGGWNADFSARTGDPSKTTIDALALDSVFYMRADEESIDVTIEGFTLINGLVFSGGAVNANVYSGFGATADSELNLTIRDNILRANRAYGTDGGGVAVYASSYSDSQRSVVNVELSGNRIEGNSAAFDGGGVHLRAYSSSSDPSRQTLFKYSLTDNEIIGNTAGDEAGGVMISFSGSAYEETAGDSSVRRNTIAGNDSPDVPGLLIDLYETNPGTLSVINNIVAGNQSVADGEEAARIDSVDSSPTVDFVNNTVVANSGLGLWVQSEGRSEPSDDFVLNMTNNVIAGNGRDGEAVYLKNRTDGNLVVNSDHNYRGLVTKSDAVLNSGGGDMDASDYPLGDDFYPSPGAVVVDAGNGGMAPATDRYGNARVGTADIGAVEYQGMAHGATMASPAAAAERRFGPVTVPVVSSLPAAAMPIAVGDQIESGVLKLRVALPAFPEPVDVYAGIYSPAFDDNVYQFAQDLSLKPLAAAGLVKWKDGISGPVDTALYGSVNVSGFPKGRYTLYLVVAPHDGLGSARYAYESHFWVR